MQYFNNFETKFFKLFATVLYTVLFQVSIIDYVFFNLYLFEVSSESIFSLVFWDLSNIDLFFTFLSIDSQPCA